MKICASFFKTRKTDYDASIFNYSETKRYKRTWKMILIQYVDSYPNCMHLTLTKDGFWSYEKIMKLCFVKI